MRRFTQLLLRVVTCALVASSAGAYTLIVDGPDLSAMGSVGIGDVVSWDIYLDTEGESGITLFSFSRSYDPSILTYRPDLSDAEDYALYAPSPSKSEPATWLVPYVDPPQIWGGAPPPIGGQVNVEFIETNLNETTATSTLAYLATLSFEVVGFGFEGGSWSLYNGGNTFFANGVESRDDVSWVFVPEPSTALLVGVGIAGLGWVARARRRGSRAAE